MMINYDEKLKMWECKEKMKDGQEMHIYITEWRDTRKGPLIDFAIFVGDNEEVFYDIELLTGKPLIANQISECCSIIISSYINYGEKFLESNIITKFPKCNIDAFQRQGMGPNRKVLKYLGKRYNFFGKIKVLHYQESKILCKPALEFPGSRLDCICD